MSSEVPSGSAWDGQAQEVLKPPPTERASAALGPAARRRILAEVRTLRGAVLRLHSRTEARYLKARVLVLASHAPSDLDGEDFISVEAFMAFARDESVRLYGTAAWEGTHQSAGALLDGRKPLTGVVLEEMASAAETLQWGGDLIASEWIKQLVAEILRLRRPPQDGQPIPAILPGGEAGVAA
jgi:hypothetical protein